MPIFSIFFFRWPVWPNGLWQKKMFIVPKLTFFPRVKTPLSFSQYHAPLIYGSHLRIFSSRGQISGAAALSSTKILSSGDFDPRKKMICSLFRYERCKTLFRQREHLKPHKQRNCLSKAEKVQNRVWVLKNEVSSDTQQ